MNCPNNSTLLIYQLYLQPKKEGNMKKQELYNKVIAYFQETIPVAETELHYNNPFELLIAVILSAQCTDKRVNMITPPLYRGSRLYKLILIPSYAKCTCGGNNRSASACNPI